MDLGRRERVGWVIHRADVLDGDVFVVGGAADEARCWDGTGPTRRPAVFDRRVFGFFVDPLRVGSQR